LKDSIDFASHIPYYIQLMDILHEKVQIGEWLPGSQIPGEQSLCDSYQISRTVVRQALRELEYEGVITRQKGKGTFVSPPKISEGLAQKLAGFYQDMLERGLKPHSRVLFQEVKPASEKVARYLGIEPGEKVVEIQRLRYANEEPIQLDTSYIPYEICPAVANVDLTDRSLYKFLEQDCNIYIARGKRNIEAVLAKEHEAALLGIERGAALLMLDSVSFTEDGRPIEYYHALHRGDRSRFEVELVRRRESTPKSEEVGGENASNHHNLAPNIGSR
jgi:GntR family transcriptional regulator